MEHRVVDLIPIYHDAKLNPAQSVAEDDRVRSKMKQSAGTHEVALVLRRQRQRKIPRERREVRTRWTKDCSNSSIHIGKSKERTVTRFPEGCSGILDGAIIVCSE